MSVVIKADFASHSSTIFIENGCRKSIDQIVTKKFRPTSFFVVIDQAVAQHFGAEVIASLKKIDPSIVHVTQISISEREKNLDQVRHLYQKMKENHLDRRGCVVVVGGGVLGDVVGFAAATFMRGVSLIHMPTTLLSQVDASVGGKVGVNFEGVKNLIGAFYQPEMVIIDPEVLVTLPKRQFLNGMAEVIKYGAISNLALFESLERDKRWSAGFYPDFFCRIAESVREKVKVVLADEKESGLRAILNFGHTLGHALELHCENLLHGEAVILGMRFASRLSQRRGLCDEETVERLYALLDNIPINATLESIQFNEIWERLSQDKKKVGQSLTFVLLKGIGQVSMHEVDKGEIEGLFHEKNLWWR